MQVHAAPTLEEMEEMFSGSKGVGVDCFDYYKFQSVQVNVGPNKSAFTAGEDVDFSGKIENENRYPVFNGYLYVRIAEKNPAYIHEGHNIVDEFIALGPISVDASSSAPVSFSWKIPENLKSGEYTANYFFSVNKKMNLGGLPFTNEIIVGFADFSIASTKTGNVSFVKSSTKVNEAKYNHIGNWPLISPDGKAVVSQVIQNTLKQDINTEISYNLYYWDSLDPKDLISTKKESLTLKAGESKTLTYEISKVELSAYYLQIVAKNENGTKSIVNMRITSDIAKPRINYFGLDNFPIQKGATTTLYSCFHNTSNISASGTTVLIAKDKVGREISRVEYSGVIPSAISAQKTEFIANSKLDYIKLEQKIYDDQKNLLDTQEIIYDVSLIKEPEIKAEPVNPVVAYALLGLIVFGFLLFFVKPIRKNKNLCLVISLVIISLAGALLVLFMQARPVKAQSTIENFQKSQSGVVEKVFGVGFNGKHVNNVFYGSVSYTYKIDTTASSPIVRKGDKISFSYSSLGFFNATGGGWDSPYLGEKFVHNSGLISSLEAAKWIPDVRIGEFRGSLKDTSCVGTPVEGCIGGALGPDGKTNQTYKGYNPGPGDSRPGYKKEVDIPQPDVTKSSDDKIMKCDSSGCTALCPGTVILTTSIKPSEVILGYQYPFPMSLYKSDRSGFRDSIPFEGFTAKWVFRVTGPSCGGGGSRGTGDIKMWADPSIVESGGESIINWETTNMSSCQAVGGWSSSTAIAGEEKMENIIEGKTFEISCSGINGTKYASTSVGLSLKKPTVQLYANPQSVDPDGKSVISWISVNAQSCHAIPVIVGTKETFWTNSTSTSGSKEVSLDKVAKTFSISCEGKNGISYSTTTINILNPKETTEVVTAACVPEQNSSSKIYINKQMTWNVVPDDVDVDLPSASTTWSGTNVSETERVGVSLDKIYTTVGLKTINATTTWKTGSTNYITTCSTSTNVMLGGGSINEI